MVARPECSCVGDDSSNEFDTCFIEHYKYTGRVYDLENKKFKNDVKRAHLLKLFQDVRKLDKIPWCVRFDIENRFPDLEEPLPQLPHQGSSHSTPVKKTRSSFGSTLSTASKKRTTSSDRLLVPSEKLRMNEFEKKRLNESTQKVASNQTLDHKVTKGSNSIKKLKEEADKNEAYKRIKVTQNNSQSSIQTTAPSSTLKNTSEKHNVVEKVANSNAKLNDSFVDFVDSRESSVVEPIKQADCNTANEGVLYQEFLKSQEHLIHQSEKPVSTPTREDIIFTQAKQIQACASRVIDLQSTCHGLEATISLMKERIKELSENEQEKLGEKEKEINELRDKLSHQKAESVAAAASFRLEKENSKLERDGLQKQVNEMKQAQSSMQAEFTTLQNEKIGFEILKKELEHKVRIKETELQQEKRKVDTLMNENRKLLTGSVSSKEIDEQVDEMKSQIKALTESLERNQYSLSFYKNENESLKNELEKIKYQKTEQQKNLNDLKQGVPVVEPTPATYHSKLETTILEQKARSAVVESTFQLLKARQDLISSGVDLGTVDRFLPIVPNEACGFLTPARK